MSTNKQAIPEWMKQQLEAETVQVDSPLAGIREFKVYNKSFQKGAVVNTELQGKIITKGDNGWVAHGSEMNVNLLCIRKAYIGFVPRINEFGDTVKDSKGNTLKDLYYTPEVDIYSKDNIALSVLTAEGERKLIGRFTKDEFMNYIKTPSIDGKVNALFKEMKTSPEGDKYTTSHLTITYIVYAMDEDTKDIIRIYPGGSIGKFNDVKPYTYEHLIQTAKTEYFSTYGMKNVLHNFVKAKLNVINEEGINFLKWEFNGFIEQSNQEELDYIRSLIVENNKQRHKGVDFDQPLQLVGIKKAIEIPVESINIKPVVNINGAIASNNNATVMKNSDIVVDGIIVPF